MKVSPTEIRRLPIVSGVLVLINVIIFLICTFAGDLLYNVGRLEVYGVLVRGEYGRVLTSMFLHKDVFHLFNNMVLLFFLGGMIEKELGHIRYALVCFFSGVGGSLLSLGVKFLTWDSSGSIGASGIVFGLDGALLALILFSERKMPTATPGKVLLMIVLSLYSGYATSGVDNAAHVGGLFFGFLTAGVFCAMGKRPGRKV